MFSCGVRIDVLLHYSGLEGNEVVEGSERAFNKGLVRVIQVFERPEIHPSGLQALPYYYILVKWRTATCSL
jgi:hypothetical protein